MVHNLVVQEIAHVRSTQGVQHTHAQSVQPPVTVSQLRQAAEHASKAAWEKDQEEDGYAVAATTTTPGTALNFTGRWRLNPAESDSIWSICSKLGAPYYVRPFVESSFFGLTSVVEHEPRANTWSEVMIKDLWLTKFSFDNDLFLDGRDEKWVSTFDATAVVRLNSHVEQDGAVVSVVEHCKFQTVQRMTRRLCRRSKDESDVCRVYNVFSYVKEDGRVQTDVYRTNFCRES